MQDMQALVVERILAKTASAGSEAQEEGPMTLADGDREKQIEQMLGACEDFTERLTDWERSFIESIREQFDGGGSLSERQTEVLERIYCKVP